MIIYCDLRGINKGTKFTLVPFFMVKKNDKYFI